MFFIIGYLIGAFFVGNTFRILIFSIPYTNKLFNSKILTEIKTIDKYNIVSLIIQILFWFIPTVIIIIFFKSNLAFYLIGIFISILLAINTFGEDKNNISEYYSKFYNYIDTKNIK